MVTINLKVSMCGDIIANSNITIAYVVNPCDSYNTDVNTPLNAIHVHVHVTEYTSTVYTVKNLGNLNGNIEIAEKERRQDWDTDML